MNTSEKCRWESGQRRKGESGPSFSFRISEKLVAFVLLLFLAQSARANDQPGLAEAPSNQPLVWDGYQKSAKMSGMNETTNFVFWVTNVSNVDVSILSTESSCDCTVAKLPAQPWVLKPGESGSLGVKMNLMGRHGQVSKVVQVTTSRGNHFLMVSADIPLMPAPFNVSARQRDQMIAQKDRQAVFRGSCAACHALPTAGHTGETLFTKACAICHISDHRAAMVPDLAALKHPTDSAYWRKWIALGKEGTLMPAFATSAGGILDTNQIESLVEYLMKAYPARTLPGIGGTNIPSARTELP
jgi:mono/diheme cytochrome c family protein